MGQHPDAHYWNRGVENVPDMTGAAHMLDCRDFKEIFPALGFSLPLEDVLDIGCGTGRLADVSRDYIGVDIAQSMVDYCTRRGLVASAIEDAADIARVRPGRKFALATAISVFTHVDDTERFLMLRAMHFSAHEIVADIIPGDGSGGIAVWTCQPERYEELLVQAGFRILGWHEWQWDQHVHRYYRAMAA